ncbi:MAG TPA: zinc ribbon domain-containing protein [Pyrinomonadaceae bacterium]|nr:zinc ribbon domain-containing protein [Pyrinomonadaceae bacterium]
MFCPQCGSTQNDELKFCTVCGANLYAVRQVVATREAGEKFDRSKTWLAEMFLSGEEAVRRQAEIERLQGLTPEVKRYNEIKAGVITSSVGIGLSVFLYALMHGIILSGNVTPGAAEILSRIWIAGIIPVMVGLALIINGVVVSKRLIDITQRSAEKGANTNSLTGATDPRALRPANTAEFIPPDFSVTEGTTKHLSNSEQKQ